MIFGLVRRSSTVLVPRRIASANRGLRDRTIIRSGSSSDTGSGMMLHPFLVEREYSPFIDFSQCHKIAVYLHAITQQACSKVDYTSSSSQSDRHWIRNTTTPTTNAHNGSALAKSRITRPMVVGLIKLGKRGPTTSHPLHHHNKPTTRTENKTNGKADFA